MKKNILNNEKFNDVKGHNEPLRCTKRGCHKLQTGDGEFCEKHYPKEKSFLEKLMEAEEKNEVNYELGYRGGYYKIAAEKALEIIGEPEDYSIREEIINCLPGKIGAGCNYLGGGVRGSVFGSVSTAEEFIEHGVPKEYAKKLYELVKVIVSRYIQLEGDLNETEDEQGETNWDALATKHSRKSGIISAY